MLSQIELFALMDFIKNYLSWKVPFLPLVLKFYQWFFFEVFPLKWVAMAIWIKQGSCLFFQRDFFFLLLIHIIMGKRKIACMWNCKSASLLCNHWRVGKGIIFDSLLVLTYKGNVSSANTFVYFHQIGFSFFFKQHWLKKLKLYL